MSINPAEAEQAINLEFETVAAATAYTDAAAEILAPPELDQEKPNYTPIEGVKAKYGYGGGRTSRIPTFVSEISVVDEQGSVHRMTHMTRNFKAVVAKGKNGGMGLEKRSSDMRIADYMDPADGGYGGPSFRRAMGVTESWSDGTNIEPNKADYCSLVGDLRDVLEAKLAVEAPEKIVEIRDLAAKNELQDTRAQRTRDKIAGLLRGSWRKS
jgi:hypothetical protein